MKITMGWVAGSLFSIGAGILIGNAIRGQSIEFKAEPTAEGVIGLYEECLAAAMDLRDSELSLSALEKTLTPGFAYSDELLEMFVKAKAEQRTRFIRLCECRDAVLEARKLWREQKGSLEVPALSVGAD